MALYWQSQHLQKTEIEKKKEKRRTLDARICLCWRRRLTTPEEKASRKEVLAPEDEANRPEVFASEDKARRPEVFVPEDRAD